MKKISILLGLILFCIQTFSAESLFPSQVRGLTITNAKKLSDSVYRGSAPSNKEHELKNLGITDVLIFKNQTKNEVDKEIQALQDLHYKKSEIHTIPFLWKDFSSQTEACEQVIQALQLLVEVEKTSNRKIYFHCSMGEDRTGLLAGLFRMLTQEWSLQKAFQQELCAGGYEAGDSNKPKHVVDAIRKDLTPIFLWLGQMIEKGLLTPANLSPQVCKNTKIIPGPEVSKSFVCKKR